MTTIGKEWIEKRVQEMSDIERRRSLAPATKEFLQSVIRHSKGILTALEKWLNSVGK